MFFVNPTQKFYKVMELVVGGSVINRPTLSIGELCSKSNEGEKRVSKIIVFLFLSEISLKFEMNSF